MLNGLEEIRKSDTNIFLVPEPNMLPVEIWMLILSYLPLIDLHNVWVCSKLFYSMALENEHLQIKLKDSHSLTKHSNLFDRYQ